MVSKGEKYTDLKAKHLEFVFSTISNISGRHLTIRGWSVGLLTAMLIYTGSDEPSSFIILASIIPAILFWSIEASLLFQERTYRVIYEQLRKDLVDDFDKDSPKDTNIPTFSISPRSGFGRVPNTLQTCFSKSLIIFHGSIIFVIFCLNIYTTIA